MGTCRYCGKSAGWFSSHHKDCQKAHDSGMADLSALIGDFFAQRITPASMSQRIQGLRSGCYLTDDDIAIEASSHIARFSAAIQRPVSPRPMHLMEDFLRATGVPFSRMNSNGAVDVFTKRMVGGLMTDYFNDTMTLAEAKNRCEKVLEKFPLSEDDKEDAYLHVLSKAATIYLRKGMPTDNEALKTEQYIAALDLEPMVLPPAYENSDIPRLAQALVLKQLQRGTVPAFRMVSGVMLSKGETVLWVYPGVSLSEEKVTREWQGRSSGWSFPVPLLKGVRYRVGGMKGHSVEHKSMEGVGVGSLYVTTKNLIFNSPTKGVRLPYSKLIGLQPYTDGVEVVRDGTNQHRLVFSGFDPSFLVNLMSLL